MKCDAKIGNLKKVGILLVFPLLLLFTLFGCTPPPKPDVSHVSELTKYDLSWIAQRIYENETSGNPEHIIIWSSKEEFLSLGIGHFIWYPTSEMGPFDDTFPLLLDFMK